MERYTYLRNTDVGKAKFGDLLRSRDWTKLIEETDLDEKVRMLHAFYEEAMNQCFDRVQVKRKSKEAPWMTEWIRKKIHQRRGVYRKYGRNEYWKKLKRQEKREVKRRKVNYAENLRKKITSGNEGNFHGYIKAMFHGEKPRSWTPSALDSNKSDLEMAEYMADHFARISQEYEPLDLSRLPQVDEEKLEPMTRDDVISLFKRARKTSIRVRGDVFESLYNDYQHRSWSWTFSTRL